MSKFLSLTMLQLRNRLNRVTTTTKQKIISSGLFLLKFAIICALIFFVLKLGLLFNILSLQDKLDLKIIVFLFTLLFFVSLINGIFGLTKSLYFAYDNPQLLVMPIKANVVFLSKLVVFFITELKKNFLFIIPTLVVVGIINNFDIAYYLLLIIYFVFLSLLSVSIGAIVSIPTMFISMTMRHFITVRYVVYGLIVAFFTWIVFTVVASIPTNFNLIQQFATYYWALQGFLADFSSNLWFMRNLTQMMTGNFSYYYQNVLPLSSLLTLGLIVAISGVLCFGVYYASRPVFHRMASSPFEYKKKLSTKSKPNHVIRPFWSSVKKEFLITLRSPDILAKDFGIILALPLSMFLLNKIFNSMNMSDRGLALATSFNLLIMTLITFCVNASTASVLSREGAAFYHLRTSPIPLKDKLIAKITIKVIASILAVVATCSMLALYFNKSNPIEWLLVGLITLLFGFGHILWSVQLDLTNPKWRQYIKDQTLSLNKNENISYGIAFAMAFIVCGFATGLLLDDRSTALIKMFLGAVAFVGVRIWFLWLRAGVAYRELY